MSLEEENKALINAVSTTIIKISMFCCISFVFAMVMHTCKVDEEVIIQCEESCGEWKGIKEVTGTTCVCGEGSNPGNKDNLWVLPRN